MRIHLALIVSLAAACGYTSTDNEAVGQVKKVVKRTPLVCSDYTEANISLGVMRNGVGSMSHEDIYLAVDNDEQKAQIATLKIAAETSAIVKFTYDVERVSPCWPSHRLVSVEIE